MLTHYAARRLTRGCVAREKALSYRADETPPTRGLDDKETLPLSVSDPVEMARGASLH